MRDIDSERAQLLHTLNSKLIPWLQTEGMLRLLFADPPIPPAPGLQIRERRPPLPPKHRLEHSDLFYYAWPEEDLASVRFILLGCVLEGEIDYIFGSDVTALPEREEAAHDPCIQVVTLPERTLFVMPPGVVRPTGSRPHWVRPDCPPANSQMFWLLIAPGAFLCHLCSTQKGVHTSTRALIF
ncbi:MAG TPA: hypothetical protein VFB21_24460, partial [Chthonomonadaceae bacterium]|nr:hypothetical protein [Chthonomonadaceae bacterium]